MGGGGGGGGWGEGGSDLALYGLAESSAQAVKVAAGGGFGPAFGGGEGGEGSVVGFAGEEGFEEGEAAGFAGAGEFVFEFLEGAPEDVERPLTVEFAVGRQGGVVGGIETGGGVGGIGEGEMGDVPTAFEGLASAALVGEPVFEGSKQVAAEPAALAVGTGKGVAAEDPFEEAVRGFTGGVGVAEVAAAGAAAAAVVAGGGTGARVETKAKPRAALEEGGDGGVVVSAEFAEGVARQGGVAPRGEDTRPVGGEEGGAGGEW